MANKIVQLTDGVDNIYPVCSENLIMPDWTYSGLLTLTFSAGSLLDGSLRYKLNSDKSIGMIYGNIALKGAGTNADCIIDTGITAKAQSTTRNINGLVIMTHSYNASYTDPVLVVDTSGKITIKYRTSTNTTYMFIPPVPIRFSDY